MVFNNPNSHNSPADNPFYSPISCLLDVLLTHSVSGVDRARGSQRGSGAIIIIIIIIIIRVIIRVIRVI